MRHLYNKISQDKETLTMLESYKGELEKQLLQITNSKFYTTWQKFTKFKKLINPKFYIKHLNEKINKFIYNPSDLEVPHHDFIVLTKETDKWKHDGYEKVGEDWHVKIIRKSDNRHFLLDQPFFYYLQIHNQEHKDQEMFITYGVNKEKLSKITRAIKLLNLC